MANVYAVKNGNWSDGSTWSSGSVPTYDDDVWLNGKTINMLNNDVLQAKTISNYANQNISVVQGGYLIGIYGVGNYTINADIYCKINYILRRFWGNVNDATYSLRINGNVFCEENAYLAISDNWSRYWLYINGNVKGGLFTNIHSNARRRVFINGNVDDNNTSLFIGTTNSPGDVFAYEQNGVLILHKPFNLGLRANTYTIAGKVKLVGVDATLNCQTYNNESYTFKISGELDIKESTATNILSASNGSIKTLNGLSIAQESAVIPPESVVLDGYQYGDKVGTLRTYQGTLVELATVIEDATILQGDATVVNLTEQEVNRVKNCATIQTVQQCFEDFKE